MANATNATVSGGNKCAAHKWRTELRQLVVDLRAHAARGKSNRERLVFLVDGWLAFP